MDISPESSRPPIDSPGQRRLPPLLRRAWYSLNQAFRRRIQHLELTPDQFTILRWLEEADAAGLTQRGLMVKMSSDPNTITSLLARMEKAGLVHRSPDQHDSRAKRVRPTAEGLERFEAARTIAAELQAAVLEAVPASQRDAFLRNLERVADSCREALQQSS